MDELLQHLNKIIKDKQFKEEYISRSLVEDAVQSYREEVACIMEKKKQTKYDDVRISTLTYCINILLDILGE